MLLRVPSPQGSIDVEADERNAPVACRCLQYQILKHGWDNAEFTVKPDGTHATLTGCSFHPEIGVERPQQLKSGQVGFVASSNELVFWLKGTGPLATVVGRFSMEAKPFSVT